MDLWHVREAVNAWTHGVWVLLCIPACIHLHRRAGRSLLKQVGLAAFSFGLIACFAGSWLYHSVPPARVSVCMQLDYIGIFLLIVGSTTPVVLVVLRGWLRWSMALLFWTMGATGVTLRILAVPLPDSVSTALYILMGWTALLCYFELARRLSHRALRPVWIGGVIYSAGGVFSALHWPNLWAPGIFGAHELSHICFMLASLCHFIFMLRVVAPYQAPTAQPAPTPELSPALIGPVPQEA
jgi:hemolysin III